MVIREMVLQQCYLCTKWWLEGDMECVSVPDQTGHVKKPVCVSCLEEIENRSKSINKSTCRVASESVSMVPKKQKMVQHRTDEDVRQQSREVRMISIDILVEAEWDTQSMSDKEFSDFVENLKEFGLLDSLRVSPLSDGRFKVISGNQTLQALRALGYKGVQCILCNDFDKDIEMFQMAWLNMIHRKLDIERFIKLYKEVVKKYGKGTVEIFMTPDKEMSKSPMKGTKDSEPVGTVQKTGNTKKDIMSMDDLGNILEEIFSKHGDTLAQGFLVFSFGRKEHHYVEMDKRLLKRMKYLEELAIAREESITTIFNRALSGKGVV
jgi:hypothetical protein